MPNSQFLTTCARRRTIILIVLLLPCAVETRFPWDSLWRSVLTVLQGPSGPRPFNTSDPTLLMNASEIIRFRGYPFENHMVATEDGYLLELHRIPHGKHSKATTHKRQPLLILPGLHQNSGTFLANGEKNSAGFLFADAGYDVWLHNNRGTRYSRKHTSLSLNEKEFWNFSFHEMGLYDLPATIDHILSITKSEQVYLMGHSMGGTIISILMAEKPSYERKVKAAFLLAPAVYVGHSKCRMLQNHTFLKIVIHLCQDMDVLTYSQNFEKGFIYLKTEHNTITKFILNIFAEVPDNKYENLVQKGIEKFTCGTSAKVLRHFIQIHSSFTIESPTEDNVATLVYTGTLLLMSPLAGTKPMVKTDTFAHYDYGRQRNLREYNQTSPPAYSLGNSKVPVFITYADKDLLVVPEDVLRGSREFGNLVRLIRVPDDEFEHLDFAVHDDAKTLVYDTILAEMEKPRNAWSKWTTTQQKTVSPETAKTKTNLSETTQAEAAPSGTAEMGSVEVEQQPSVSTQKQLLYAVVITIFIIMIAGLVLALARNARGYKKLNNKTCEPRKFEIPEN